MMTSDIALPSTMLAASVEVFREMLEADRAAGELTEVRKAAYGYLTIALDTLLNYNNRAGRWDSTTGRVRSIFDQATEKPPKPLPVTITCKSAPSVGGC